MLQSFFVKREFFLTNKDKSFVSGTKSFYGSGFSLSFFKFKFLKPRLSKVFFNFSNFPCLVLSNGGLFFYNSAYSFFMVDSKQKQSGLILFDDLYSYKNKIIF